MKSLRNNCLICANYQENGKKHCSPQRTQRAQRKSTRFPSAVKKILPPYSVTTRGRANNMTLLPGIAALAAATEVATRGRANNKMLLRQQEAFPDQSDADLDRQVKALSELANSVSDLSDHLDKRRGNSSPPFNTDVFLERFSAYLPGYIALTSSSNALSHNS
jgi:hypothetical protein